MKKILLFSIGAILVLNVIGCETVKGVGRDLKNTGDNIYEAVTGK